MIFTNFYEIVDFHEAIACSPSMNLTFNPIGFV